MRRRLPGRLHPGGRPHARIDAAECIDCDACVPECPVEAIFPDAVVPKEWAPFVRINAAFNEGMAAVDLLVNERYPEDDDGPAGVREPRRPGLDAPPDAV